MKNQKWKSRGLLWCISDFMVHGYIHRWMTTMVMEVSPTLKGDEHREAQPAQGGKVGAVGGARREWQWRNQGQHREWVPGVGKEFV